MKLFIFVITAFFSALVCASNLTFQQKLNAIQETRFKRIALIDPFVQLTVLYRNNAENLDPNLGKSVDQIDRELRKFDTTVGFPLAYAGNCQINVDDAYLLIPEDSFFENIKARIGELITLINYRLTRNR